MSGAAQNLTVGGNGSITISGVVGTTAGSLAKDGAGMLTLNGNNTYSGGTTLSVGTLNINNASAIGTGTLTISGGALDNTSGASITLTTNNAQSWNGDFTFIGTNNLNLGTGAVTMNDSLIVTVNGGNLTIGGAIAGSGFGLTENGTGNLILSGNNTYTGTTTVSAGTLSLGASNILSDSSNLTVNGGTFNIGGYDETVNVITMTNGTCLAQLACSLAQPTASPAAR
jgi:autotransporter-associated beta strand protein